MNYSQKNNNNKSPIAPSHWKLLNTIFSKNQYDVTTLTPSLMISETYKVNILKKESTKVCKYTVTTETDGK